MLILNSSGEGAGGGAKGRFDQGGTREKATDDCPFLMLVGRRLGQVCTRSLCYLHECYMGSSRCIVKKRESTGRFLICVYYNYFYY